MCARRKLRTDSCATINSLLEPRPRKFVGAARNGVVVTIVNHVQKRTRGGHNGGAIFGPTQAAKQPGSREMRSMSDASSRCADHVTKDSVVSTVRRTIRIIRRHATSAASQSPGDRALGGPHWNNNFCPD